MEKRGESLPVAPHKKKQKVKKDDDNDRRRSEIVAAHAVERKELLKRHAKEIADFDYKCKRELELAGFTDDDMIHSRRKRLGSCCICDEELANGSHVVDNKSPTKDEGNDREPHNYVGEPCFSCVKLGFKKIACLKCSDCKWPMLCSKDARHGFCPVCIKDVEEEDDPTLFCIPTRDDPSGEEDWLQRDHLHPFQLCDCDICAWCGEDNDDCCIDHRQQTCSCFPERI